MTNLGLAAVLTSLARRAAGARTVLSGTPPRLILLLAIALLASQVSVALAPEAGMPEALRTGARVLVGTVLLILVADLVLLLAFPTRWFGSLILGIEIAPAHIAIAGAAFVAMALMRTPHRAVANVAGYVLVGVPLLWLAHRQAGPQAARTAALALALFAFFPTHANVPAVERLTYTAPGSPFRWSTGWPAPGWLLRHEIELAHPLNGPWRVALQLAAPNPNPPSVLARLNGVEVTSFRSASPDEIEFDLPPALLSGTRRLVFEFRPASPSSQLQVSAHRWTAGTRLGAGASSFFDGERWHAGTFDDGAGRVVPGVYSIELRPH